MMRHGVFVVVVGFTIVAESVAAQTVTYAPADRQIAPALSPLPAPLRGHTS
jgi:hypothetical protein